MNTPAPLPSNRRTVIPLVMIVAGMTMLSFAAVPLYDLFCKVTGFGGTTQVNTVLPERILERSVTISFNADMDPKLPWRFSPPAKPISLRIGEQQLTSYIAENLADAPTSGMAVYNVTPHEAGRYFHKVQCFCFDYQTLEPHQVVNMPVSFFIDPKFDEDPQLKGVKHITLSYTFFSETSKN